MSVDLDPDTEKAVNEEVLAVRFRSAQEFIDIAVRQFLVARDFGEEEARKPATLRAELKDLFDEIEAEGMSRLADQRGRAR